MYSKNTRRQAPRKDQLLKTLAMFVAAIEAANGLLIVEGERRKRTGPSLDSAYRKAAKVLGKKTAPIAREQSEDFEEMADALIGRHFRLYQLAKDRGYSPRALAKLLLSAEQADYLKTVAGV